VNKEHVLASIRGELMSSTKKKERGAMQAQHLLNILDYAESGAQFVYMFRQFLNSMVGNTQSGKEAIIAFYEKEEELIQLFYDVAGQTFLEMSFKKRKRLTALYYGGLGWQFHQALAEVNYTILEKIIAILEISAPAEDSDEMETLH